MYKVIQMLEDINSNVFIARFRNEEKEKRNVGFEEN